MDDNVIPLRSGGPGDPAADRVLVVIVDSKVVPGEYQVVISFGEDLAAAEIVFAGAFTTYRAALDHARLKSKLLGGVPVQDLAPAPPSVEDDGDAA